MDNGSVSATTDRYKGFTSLDDLDIYVNSCQQGIGMHPPPVISMANSKYCGDTKTQMIFNSIIMWITDFMGYRYFSFQCTEFMIAMSPSGYSVASNYDWMNRIGKQITLQIAGQMFWYVKVSQNLIALNLKRTMCAMRWYRQLWACEMHLHDAGQRWCIAHRI